MEKTLDFIKPELLILVPVLYFVGLAMKKSNMLDRRIPAFLGAISILLSTLWVFSTTNINSWQEVGNAMFTSITQGVLAAGTSVYINQLYIQSKKSD